MAAETELRALATRRWRVAIALTATMMATYFGFILLVAYGKETAGALVMRGLSWGILLGALVIVVAWAVTGVYVWWANRIYDVELERLRARGEEDGAPHPSEGTSEGRSRSVGRELEGGALEKD